MAPAGIFVGNNGSLKPGLSAGAGDHTQAGAINLLYDPQIQRELMLVILRNTRKTGLLVPGIHKGEPMERSYPSSMASISGLLHKYVLTTGDIALLNEDIGGISLLQRLEEALEAQLAYRDDQTGLFRTDNELPTDANNVKGFSGGFGPNQENVTRFRGGAGTFYNDTNGVVYGKPSWLWPRSRRLRKDRTNGTGTCGWPRSWERPFSSTAGVRICSSSATWTRRAARTTTWVSADSLPACSRTRLTAPAGWRHQRKRKGCRPGAAIQISPVTTVSHRWPAAAPTSTRTTTRATTAVLTCTGATKSRLGLYAHGCLEEAHIQMLKLFRRLGTNGGLGPRYRGEVYQPDTGEIVPFRFPSYPCILSALTSVIEGAFGLRWTTDGLAIDTQTPWDWASLRNLRIRGCKLDLVLSAGGKLTARIDGREAASSAEGNLLLPWEVFDHK